MIKFISDLIKGDTVADENTVPDVSNHETSDIVDPLNEIKSKIRELQDGLMEIATQVGRLKGELKAHKEKPDAHHPAMLPKDVN